MYTHRGVRSQNVAKAVLHAIQNSIFLLFSGVKTKIFYKIKTRKTQIGTCIVLSPVNTNPFWERFIFYFSTMIFIFFFHVNTLSGQNNAFDFYILTSRPVRFARNLKCTDKNNVSQNKINKNYFILKNEYYYVEWCNEIPKRFNKLNYILYFIFIYICFLYYIF